MLYIRSSMTKNTTSPKPPQPNIFSLLGPYKGMIALLVLFTVGANFLNLLLPKIISRNIDRLMHGTFSLEHFIVMFGIAAIGIFILTYLQSIIQVYASERVARDIRMKLASKISMQNHAYIDKATPAKLLTNLTNDADAVKNFVAQAISSIISSVFLIIGAAILLCLINWRLALAVLAVVPIIGITFSVIFKKVGSLFKDAQKAIDWLNKVINESILGAALIRIVNAQQSEYNKFLDANKNARDISIGILKLFASLIPIITFFTNMAVLVILCLGGHFVINGSMSLGDFTAFQSYLSILIFPIIILGFTSNMIAQATASYGRIEGVLNAPDTEDTGTVSRELEGTVSVSDLSLSYQEKEVLRNVSFTVEPGTRTAIIGPTAAGKTQLLYILTSIVAPTAGTVLYDGIPVSEYKKQRLHEQVGFVFQDSIMFNLTLRENIAFSNAVTDESLQKAIETAELNDFIGTLPKGLDTIVSERGTSLSGGQKQRVMLARALALNPKVLLLDDFTARVDARTENKILDNMHKNYPTLTLISVTQKIASVESYDQILLLEDGEILARGTHTELMQTSPEYVQIFNSQESTEHYG